MNSRENVSPLARVQRGQLEGAAVRCSAAGQGGRDPQREIRGDSRSDLQGVS